MSAQSGILDTIMLRQVLGLRAPQSVLVIKFCSWLNIEVNTGHAPFRCAQFIYLLICDIEEVTDTELNLDYPGASLEKVKGLTID